MSKQKFIHVTGTGNRLRSFAVAAPHITPRKNDIEIIRTISIRVRKRITISKLSVLLFRNLSLLLNSIVECLIIFVLAITVYFSIKYEL